MVRNGAVRQIEVTESTDASGTTSEIRIYLTEALRYATTSVGNSLKLNLDGAWQ